MSVSWGPRPWSQSWRLASVSAIMPKRGRGGRRFCVMAAGIGERHHAEAWAGRPALLRRRQFGGPQDAAHGLAADREVLFAAKFFRQMGIVETLILAAGQAQDQLLL